jgi:hypothetical protein
VRSEWGRTGKGASTRVAVWLSLQMKWLKREEGDRAKLEREDAGRGRFDWELEGIRRRSVGINRTELGVGTSKRVVRLSGG